MLGVTSIWHWLIVLLVIAIIFGTKRLRNIGSDLGGAIRGFKEGLQDGKSENTQEMTQRSEIRSDINSEQIKNDNEIAKPMVVLPSENTSRGQIQNKNNETTNKLS